MKVYGLWWGGINYGHPYVDEDLESFDSIDEAIRALEDRAKYGHRESQTFNYIHKEIVDCLTPNADDGAEMRIYFGDPMPTGNSDLPDIIFGVDENGNAIPV